MRLRIPKQDDLKEDLFDTHYIQAVNSQRQKFWKQ